MDGRATLHESEYVHRALNANALNTRYLHSAFVPRTVSSVPLARSTAPQPDAEVLGPARRCNAQESTSIHKGSVGFPERLWMQRS